MSARTQEHDKETTWRAPPRRKRGRYNNVASEHWMSCMPVRQCQPRQRLCQYGDFTNSREFNLLVSRQFARPSERYLPLFRFDPSILIDDLINKSHILRFLNLNFNISHVMLFRKSLSCEINFLALIDLSSVACANVSLLAFFCEEDAPASNMPLIGTLAITQSNLTSALTITSHFTVHG